MTTQKTIPSESQHWYDLQGNPCYTIIGKNGKERPTTLRDARSIGLVPSVTTIMKEAAKFGLEKWKQEQVLLAALTLPRIEGETEQEYVDRIIEDSKQQAIQAAERGKQIHAWIQQGFDEELSNVPLEAYQYLVEAANEVRNWCGVNIWQCESSFATNRYGGKVDLNYPVSPGIVLDIKTKEVLTDKTPTIYDEHAMQLGAYREGLLLPNAQCGILFVGAKDKQAKLVWIPEEKLQRGTKMFNALLDYWYTKTGLGE